MHRPLTGEPELGFRKWLWLSFLWLCWGASVVCALSPLYERGLAPGNDVPLHVGNITESAVLLAHQWPPWSWLPDIAGGYGGPNFCYYGHLSFVPPAWLVNLGVTPVDAIRIVVAAGFLVGACSMFCWCFSQGGLGAAALGVVLFLNGPYYLSLPFVRGSYPEFFAYCLYPAVFHATEIAARKHSVSAMCCAAFVLALVLGLHTLSLVLIVPFLIAYAVVQSVHARSISPLCICLSTVLLGCLIAAPFLWAPLFEKGRIAVASQFESADLYASMGVPWYTFLNWRPSREVLSYQVPGRVHLGCLAVGLAICLSRRSELRNTRCLSLLVLGAMAYVLSERSVARVMVEIAPVLRYLQFPFRLLGVANLFVSGGFSVAVASAFRPSWRACHITYVVVPVLCIWTYAGVLPPQDRVQFRTASVSGLRASLSTLDHEDKYLPLSARLPPVPAEDKLLELESMSATAELVNHNANDYSFMVSQKSDGVARFHQYWFKGWRCQVDGAPFPITRGGELGISLIWLPAGQHRVRIWYDDLPGRRTSKLVSLTVVALLCLVSLASCLTGAGYFSWSRCRVFRRRTEKPQSGRKVPSDGGSRP